MVCLRSFSVILALLLALCLESGARSETPPTPSPPSPAQAMQMAGQLCAAICRQRLQGCTTSGLAAEAKTPTCDTEFIVCTVNCPTCVGAFAQCERAKGGAPQACQQPFLGCMRGAGADGTSSRPLIRFTGGDGASQQSAVVIVGARNESEGIVAEFVWASKTHPTWRKERQFLFKGADRSYDKIGYTAPDGAHEAWFDITGFFGKM